jgi:hypothetical protein
MCVLGELSLRDGTAHCSECEGRLLTVARKVTSRPLPGGQTHGVHVLETPVDVELLDSWRQWLAPDTQPFFVDTLRAWPRSAPQQVLTPELRDTYTVWRMARPPKTLWLTEDAFLDKPRAKRAALVRSQVTAGRGAVPTIRAWGDLVDPVAARNQADGHRFTWWPSLVARNRKEILTRFVSGESEPSRHAEVSDATWEASGAVVPAARRLAGTFPPSSGPNCFGTVMAAAGVRGAEEIWVLQDRFQRWLTSSCRPGGHDDDPGTVFVWRDKGGLPVHAAITLGDGWALEKPSQCWWTPRVVITTEDAKRVNRAPGQRLERHHVARIDHPDDRSER